MDSEEAIMENENNSNVESESGIRAQSLSVEGLYDGVSAVVTDVPMDITPSVDFDQVDSADSSPLNETVKSKIATTGKSSNENLDKNSHVYEDLIGADSSENYEAHSSVSCNVGCEFVDREKQGYLMVSNSGSHEEVDTTLSENSKYSKNTQVQHGEIMNPTFPTAETNSQRKPEVNATTITESNNANQTTNSCNINHPESYKVFSMEGTSKDCIDEEVNLLDENSQDSSNRYNVDRLANLGDSGDIPAVNDENMTLEHNEVSSHVMETVNDCSMNEESVEFAQYKLVKIVTGNIVSESGSCNAEQEDIDELLKEKVSAKKCSENLLEQPHADIQDYDRHVLYENTFTCVENVNVSFSDNVVNEIGVSQPKVDSNPVHKNISSVNNDMDLDVGDEVQESETDDSKICSTKGEESFLKTTVEGTSDCTVNITSFSDTITKRVNSSVEDAAIDSRIKNFIQIDDSMKTTTNIVDSEPPISSVDVASTCMPQSNTNSNSGLIMENITLDKFTSLQSLDEPESTSGRDLEMEKTTTSIASTEKVNSHKGVTEKVNSRKGVTKSSNGCISSELSLTKSAGTGCRNVDENCLDMEISKIKKEHSATDVNVSTGDSSVNVSTDDSSVNVSTGDSSVNASTGDSSALLKNVQLSERIKQEPSTDKAEDSEEEVMVIDDDGEIVPLKSEILESSTAQNGLDIQISSVSGQQHDLHASKEKISDTSPDLGNKTDSPRNKAAKSKVQTCIVCQKICRCKYNIVRNGDTKHLCDDTCFKKFRKSPGVFLKPKDDLKTVNVSSEDMLPTLPDSLTPAESKHDKPHKTCIVCQLIDIKSHQSFCNWKGLDFCGEICLEKFQTNLGKTCSFCHVYIPVDLRTTFCLKIGNDMRPFCKQRCYSEFKKKLRLCSFCQRDVAAVPEAFTAMVGRDGKFKEFCSQTCMKKLESQISDVEILSVEKGNLMLETITCSVCKKHGPMKYTVRLQDRVNVLCSDLCLSAFQYTNKINMGKCDSCGTAYTTEEAQAHFVQYEGKVKRFCSDICVSQFRKSNSKEMPCGWCNIKKPNFDMIERLDAENKFQMFCSLTCLSLFRVNLQAKSNQAVSCDQCRKVVPAQYHLTMSDASVLNFCSYSCVATFQTQFAVKQASSNLGSIPPTQAASLAQLQVQQQSMPIQQGMPVQKQSMPVQQQITPVQQQSTPVQQKTFGPAGRMTTRQVSAKHQASPIPVISNVISLAQHGEGLQVHNLQTPKSSSPAVLAPTPETTTAATDSMMTSGDGKHQIIIQAALPKYGKNKSLQCRPITQTKATSCRPHSQSKEVQTDEVVNKPILIPVPVPIYIPMPTVMFSAPTPKLIPFPIPVPVPIFIPTTIKSINGICKTIQDIVERIPTDPLEAELLMMAEAVAEGKIDETNDASDTEADTYVDEFDVLVENEVMSPLLAEDESPLRKIASTRDEDVLQVALTMAEEMSVPVEDLETSLELVAVSKEPPLQQQKTVQTHHNEDDADYSPPQILRGRVAKRSNRGRPPSSRSKRQRLERPYNDDDSMQEDNTPLSHSMEPAPDANYRLKFTYGINAWRHWVISKNMQIEKSRSEGQFRGRVFPTDILKCTMDELNMSLCMFVKEVRKPSGEEYSPDSVYYLCLGLQQYLYENGRIDSIFTDTYFEKFTDCMHEILKTLKPKVNNQGQMLCRIEEEHLWESKHLGAHSPFVLLNTLIYFHTKHFILKTVEDHMTLSFAQILKHWKKGLPVKGQTTSGAKNVSLRFYCLANGRKDNFVAKKGKEGVPMYEVVENIDNPLRCPVKLYEFFLSKCPESIKNRNDIFYPVPERSCVPDSPVWYSTQSIDFHTLDKMLTRILLVREIQEAHLHAQPIYA